MRIIILIIASCFVIACVNFAVGFITNSKKQLLMSNISALTTEQSEGVKKQKHTSYSKCEGITATVTGTRVNNTGYAQTFKQDGSVSGEAGANVKLVNFSVSGSYTAGFGWSGNTSATSNLEMSFTVNSKRSNDVAIVECGPEPSNNLCYKSDPCMSLLYDRVNEAMARFGLTNYNINQ